MVKKTRNISKKWIEQICDYFREFLEETGLPSFGRMGQRSPGFHYPEWLIMVIAVLSVKLRIKSYVQTHEMAIEYWDLIAKNLNLKPISERQLRERLKKINHHPKKPAIFIFQMFPDLEQGLGD